MDCGRGTRSLTLIPKKIRKNIFQPEKVIMEYEVGKPYMLGFWVYDSEHYFKVRYWTQVSMLEDGP